jgi:hypothetical protein
VVAAPLLGIRLRARVRAPAAWARISALVLGIRLTVSEHESATRVAVCLRSGSYGGSYGGSYTNDPRGSSTAAWMRSAIRSGVRPTSACSSFGAPWVT